MPYSKTLNRNTRRCNVLEEIRNEEKLYPNNYRDMQNFNRFMESPTYENPQLPVWKMKGINGPSRKSYWHPKPLEDRIYRNKVGPYNDNKKLIWFNNWQRYRDPFYENRSKGRTDFWQPGTRKGDGNFRLPDSLIAQNTIRPLVRGKPSWDRTIEEKTGITLPTMANKYSVPRKRSISVLNTHLNKNIRASTEPKGRRDIVKRSPYVHGINDHTQVNHHTNEKDKVIRTLNKERGYKATGGDKYRTNNGSILHMRPIDLSYASTNEAVIKKREARQRRKQDRTNIIKIYNRNGRVKEGFTQKRNVYIGNQINRPPQFGYTPTYQNMIDGNLNGIANYNPRVSQTDLNPINGRIDNLLLRKLRSRNTFP